jgi:S-formylglutathione hydrolase FrmB
VVSDPGKHDWPSAASALPIALPWLAGRLGTTGVPAVPLPGAPGSS